MRALSFFLPFRNEVATLRSTVEAITVVAKAHLDDHEIVLVDDHSSDGSSEVAAGLAKENHVRVVTLVDEFGFGAGFLAGLRTARFEFAMYLAADGDASVGELTEILRQWEGRRPLIQFCTNDRSRAPARFLLSRAYSEVVRRLSGTTLPYYNGFNILPTRKPESTRLMDFGFCTQAHAVLTLLSSTEIEPQLVGTV
ncbi:MAG: glycosyltransferase, partial [Bdellovibrionota bacterium]